MVLWARRLLADPDPRPPGRPCRFALGTVLVACCLLPSALWSSALALPPHAAPEPPKPKSLDVFKLPATAIVIVVDEAEKALKMVPKSVVLSPEKFQELLQEIEQLRAQLKPEKPSPPSACKLTAKLDGDIAHVQAVFEFHTDRDQVGIGLACPQGNPTDAKLDGRLPLLELKDDGFRVQVEKAGDHELILKMDVALNAPGAKSNEHGFELELPRAAVTTFALDVPLGVNEVRVQADGRGGTRTLTPKPSDNHRARVDAGALGPIKHLDVRWAAPLPLPAGPPLLAADGRTTVRIDQATVIQDAELKLQVLRGQTRQWRVQVPADAVVEILSAQGETRAVATVEPTDARNPTLRTIRLKEPSNEPLQVLVRVQRRRTDAPIAVGPFVVLGAFRQHGAVLVTAPPDLRLRFVPRGGVSQREVSAEDQRRESRAVAAFSYWNLPATEKTAAAGTDIAPILEVTAETVKGFVETSASHTIGMTPRGWRVVTDIEVRPLPTVDHLQVQLPLGYVYDERVGPRPAEIVRGIDVDAQRVLRVSLTPRSEPFHLIFEGTFPGPLTSAGQTALDLPTPLNTLDRGGQVTVQVPDDVELTPLRPGDSIDDRHKHRWSTDRLPTRAEIAWRAYQPELVVTSDVQVTLMEGQTRVAQAFHFAPAKPATAPVLLLVPESLGDDVRLTNGATWIEQPSVRPGYRTWSATLNKPPGKDAIFTLEYQIAQPRHGNNRRESASNAIVNIPLVVPAQATQTEAWVYVWSQPGTVPVLETGPWDEPATRTRPTPGHETLPALVLHGTRLDTPLTLHVRDASGTLLSTAIVERVLVRAAVVEGGFQEYRASFLLRQLINRHLDLELPAPPASLDLRVTLDGQPLGRHWDAVDENGKLADGGRIARLTIGPWLSRKPAVLEVSYQLAPGRTGSGVWQTQLQPPLIHGDLRPAPVRWMVSLPSNWVPLYREGVFSAEQRWGWRGWLPAPRPAATAADLERWFAGDEPPGNSAEDNPVLAVTCWRAALEPLPLLHVPQQLWLAVCSLLFLVVCLGLCYAPLPRSAFWLIVALLAAGLLTIALLRPGVLGAVTYGAEPGIVVAALVVGTQWLLHRRYRRRLVFMPGFTRLKSGSSLIRPGSSHSRSRGEPTTVDAAAAAAALKEPNP